MLTSLTIHLSINCAASENQNSLLGTELQIISQNIQQKHVCKITCWQNLTTTVHSSASNSSGTVSKMVRDTGERNGVWGLAPSGQPLAIGQGQS